MNETEPTKPPAKLPFDPHPEESNKAFEAFLCYFDLGEHRALTKVAEKLSVNLGSIKSWARRFHWQQRVQSYNRHLFGSKITAQTDALKAQAAAWAARREQFKEDEWRASEKLLKIVNTTLDDFVKKQPEDVTLHDVVRALEVVSKVGRLSTGLVTGKQEITGADGGAIKLEIIEAVRRVYGAEVVDVEAQKLLDP